MEDEIDLKQYLDVIIKHWKIIALIGVIAASIGLYQGVKQPKLYKATATIMITDSGGGGLGSALSAMSFLGGGIGGGMSGGEGKLTSLLKSRALAQEIAKSIDLEVVFSKQSMNTRLSANEKFQSAVNSLRSSIDAKLEKNGLLEISMEWSNPTIAADLANKYVIGLGKFLNEHALNINFQVIDAALPPDRPFNKHTSQTAGVGMIIGVFLGTLVAFFLEYWEKVRKQF